MIKHLEFACYIKLLHLHVSPLERKKKTKKKPCKIKYIFFESYYILVIKKLSYIFSCQDMLC